MFDHVMTFVLLDLNLVIIIKIGFKEVKCSCVH